MRMVPSETINPVTLVPMLAPITANTAVSIGICPAATSVMISDVVNAELWTMEVPSSAPHSVKSGWCPCAI